MHFPYCTVTTSNVRDLARDSLRQLLPWQPYGRLVSVDSLLDLLLFVASLGSSLSAIVQRFAFGFSHETARKAVAANLPLAPSDLVPGIAKVLCAFLPARLLGRRHWVVAIDEHRVPFYGQRPTPGVTGGAKKHGSKFAFAYATAVLVHRRHRFTLALIPLDGSLKPHQLVAKLLDSIYLQGLKLRGVVLDAAFDSGETILLLQERQLSYAVPLRRKGNRNNRRNAIWNLAAGTRTTVEWQTEKSRRKVKTQVLVWHRSGGEVKVLAYAGWGTGKATQEAERARRAPQWYRKRFGIETSYRQLNQARGMTTAKGGVYRLLLIAIALVLRQAWVYLTAQVARARRLRPSVRVADLLLTMLLDWIADCLKSLYKQDLRIPIGDNRLL